jgi:predicted metal-dependent hydrolase
MSTGPAWRDPFELGRAAFNRGEFFAAHERWEEAWRHLQGPARIGVQGLIQIAAGLHHLQRGRSRPAIALLGKGLEKLSRGVPEALAEWPIEALARDIARCLADLEGAGVRSGSRAPRPARRTISPWPRGRSPRM